VFSQTGAIHFIFFIILFFYFHSFVSMIKGSQVERVSSALTVKALNDQRAAEYSKT